MRGSLVLLFAFLSVGSFLCDWPLWATVVWSASLLGLVCSYPARRGSA